MSAASLRRDESSKSLPPTAGQLVAINLAMQSRQLIGAMRELHDAMSGNPAVLDAADLWLAFEARLALGATCLSPAIAMPHARSKSVNRLLVCMGRSADGIEVDSTFPGVRLVFLVVAPPDHISEYLRFMAGLSRFLRQPGHLAALLGANTDAEVRALLRDRSDLGIGLATVGTVASP